VICLREDGVRGGSGHDISPERQEGSINAYVQLTPSMVRGASTRPRSACGLERLAGGYGLAQSEPAASRMAGAWDAPGRGPLRGV